jgi:hypothetical protein
VKSLRLLLLLSPFLTVACASAPPPPASPAPAVAAGAPAASAPVVATVAGHAVTAEELDAHAATTKLGRPEALGDLIDLTLLRAACAEHGVAFGPGEPPPEGRAAAELAVARKLGLEVPPDANVVVVDHAWIKDAKKASVTAQQKKSLATLREKVLAGESLPTAFKTLPGIDGEAWHIGDHEEYPYDVVPPEAHDLPPGSVSPIIPGNGGLHLFKILDRKLTPPPPDAVHARLRDRLREGKMLEIRDPTLR